jgi:uncharacterized membrane protein YtjA (UPF0391 family)
MVMTMFRLGLAFVVIAFVAALVGFGAGFAAAGVAEAMFIFFLLLFFGVAAIDIIRRNRPPAI